MFSYLIVDGLLLLLSVIVVILWFIWCIIKVKCLLTLRGSITW
jgi:hypothetical protein